ncbi:hypothetical protein GLE_4275 [Lysobacter enzymogenes]|uniref:Uncharacterized protein n=1 Tax=Lysobacter enzymogenes TaxID=69 RepID=A0A0S2DM41_LYSEN|nr:hypothetical protein GLE_4275 [Lysobacter enzymogenes]
MAGDSPQVFMVFADEPVELVHALLHVDSGIGPSKGVT